MDSNGNGTANKVLWWGIASIAGPVLLGVLSTLSEENGANKTGRDAFHNLVKTPSLTFETVLSRAGLRPQ